VKHDQEIFCDVSYIYLANSAESGRGVEGCAGISVRRYQPAARAPGRFHRGTGQSRKKRGTFSQPIFFSGLVLELGVLFKATWGYSI
jgi:hypothetical protein